MNKTIVVFGSYAADLMGRGNRLPAPGETLKGSTFHMGAGGKGFNQAVAAAKVGGDVKLITRLGRDGFGQLALDTMKEQGMTCDHILFGAESSGVALITVDEVTGQNQILVIPGACGNIQPQEVEQLRPVLTSADYLLAQLEVNGDANLQAITMAKESGCTVILNPAPAGNVEELLPMVDIVTPNETEAMTITGICVDSFDNCVAAATYFHRRGVRQVVITLGSQGTFYHDDQVQGLLPPFPVTAVDTTGAGDAFNGGFVAALAKGMSFPDAVRYGSAVGALSVTKMGTSASAPSQAEVESFLKGQAG